MCGVFCKSLCVKQLMLFKGVLFFRVVLLIELKCIFQCVNNREKNFLLLTMLTSVSQLYVHLNYMNISVFPYFLSPKLSSHSSRSCEGDQDISDPHTS